MFDLHLALTQVDSVMPLRLLIGESAHKFDYLRVELLLLRLYVADIVFE